MTIVLAARLADRPAADDLCLAVAGRKLIVTTDWRFPHVKDLHGTEDLVPLGTLDGVPVWGGLAPSTLDPPHEPHSWTSLAARLPAPLAALAGRALQIVTWRRTHRYCGSCTAELSDVEGEHARRCVPCGLFVPMQLSPAVLVLVRRPSGELLLVRHTYGPTAIWALVAGFVESGETLEEAVHREVAEEVGLRVRDLSYRGSQPWAMSGPGVLLVGFTAACADPAAEPVADGREIAEAAWFPPGDLPEPLPPEYSISRWLIDGL